MKKLLVILALCLPALLVAQMTNVPDDNFEQALIDLGYDTPPLNDSVPTKNIDTVTYLYVFGRRISDLTGIEDFKALKVLLCYYNTFSNLDVSKNSNLTVLDCSSSTLTSLDVSSNNALTYLGCGGNALTGLDVSNNTALTRLHCHHNSLTSLDVSKNSALTHLDCRDNLLTSLDVTNNSELTGLYCSSNALTSLDVFSNTALTWLYCFYNPDLYCIQVSDSAMAANNTRWKKDDHAIYSEDCSLVSVEEETNPTTTISPNPARDYIEISGVVGEVKLYDVLGAEVLTHPQTPSREGELSRIDVSSLSPGVYFVSVGGKMYKFMKM